jgi:hypothetical protein
MKHVCDNCGKKWDLRSVVYAKSMTQRVNPGGVVPSGECPECGALCYPERLKQKKSELILYCDNPDCKHSKVSKCDMTMVNLKRGYMEGRESVLVCLSFDDKIGS